MKIGIMASQISGHLATPNNYESIATTTLSSTNTITFSSIPATYTHLQIRVLARSQRADTGDLCNFRFNGDTATNYSAHNLNGDGSNVYANAYATNAQIYGMRVAANSASANVFGVGVFDILDYANTNKYKTTRSLCGYDNNGSGEIYFMSGNWRSTSAITSITIVPNVGTGFLQYSSFALYGVK
jgi:hypothetical protein